MRPGTLVRNKFTDSLATAATDVRARGRVPRRRRASSGVRGILLTARRTRVEIVRGRRASSFTVAVVRRRIRARHRRETESISIPPRRRLLSRRGRGRRRAPLTSRRARSRRRDRHHGKESATRVRRVRGVVQAKDRGRRRRRESSESILRNDVRGGGGGVGAVVRVRGHPPPRRSRTRTRLESTRQAAAARPRAGRTRGSARPAAA